MGWEHACMHYCSDGDKDEDGTLDADAFAVFASCAMCRLAYTINTCVYWRPNRVAAEAKANNYLGCIAVQISVVYNLCNTET